MNDYGKLIKEARKKVGFTQKKLAETAGIATITIQQYESGKRQPRLEQLMKIAEVLNVNVEELLGVRPLPAKEITINPGFPSEYKEMQEGKMTERTAVDFFLEEIGYKEFLYSDEADPGKLIHDKEVIYDCREGKPYIVTREEMDGIRESITAFAKFQMNELFSKTGVATGKNIESHLEFWREMGLLSSVKTLNEEEKK